MTLSWLCHAKMSWARGDPSGLPFMRSLPATDIQQQEHIKKDIVSHREAISFYVAVLIFPAL